MVKIAWYWIPGLFVFGFLVGYVIRGAKEFRKWARAKAEGKLEGLWKGK